MNKILLSALFSIFLFAEIAVANTPVTDSVTYTYTSLKKRNKNIITTEKDTVYSTFEVNYPVFNESKLNLLTKLLVFSTQGSDAPFVEIVEYADAFLKEAYDTNIEEADYPRSWSRDIRLEVKKQIPGTSTLSFTLIDDSYTGGAHGLVNLYYLNFDHVNNEVISLENILQNNSLDKLNAIGDVIFRKQEGLAPNASLENYFFEDGKFKLNKNFLIESKGLRFWFNSYEVRSYAEGPLEIFIPYTAIQTLLKPNPYTPKSIN